MQPLHDVYFKSAFPLLPRLLACIKHSNYRFYISLNTSAINTRLNEINVKCPRLAQQNTNVRKQALEM